MVSCTKNRGFEKTLFFLEMRCPNFNHGLRDDFLIDLIGCIFGGKLISVIYSVQEVSSKKLQTVEKKVTLMGKSLKKLSPRHGFQ